MRANAWIFGVMLGLWGCGPDLGTCPADYPMQLVNGVHPGQNVVNGSCASGRCHSRSATGDLRNGAPAELDFDMTFFDNATAQTLVDTAGVSTTREWADHMWGEIEAGTMPPGAPLDAAQKENARAFLACGVKATVATQPMAPGGNEMFATMVVPSFSASCLGCHSPMTSASGGGFVLGTANDACSMYSAIVSQVSSCASGQALPNQTLVEPGQPMASVLVSKLDNGPALCSALMPLGATPMNTFAIQQPAVYQALVDWVMAGAPKPAGCP